MQPAIMHPQASPFDPDSTLVRRGARAVALSELEDFVESMQHRPLDKLLAELPGLAALSETKFSLARQVIRRRARTLQRADFEQLRVMAFEVAQAATGEIGDRIRSLFTFA